MIMSVTDSNKRDATDIVEIIFYQEIDLKFARNL